MAKKQKLLNLGYTNISYKIEENNTAFLRQIKRYTGFNHRLDYYQLKNLSFVPKLLMTNQQKTEWEFIEGRTLNLENETDLKKVAKVFSELHLSKNQFPSSNLIDRMQNYYQKAKKMNPHQIPQEIFDYHSKFIPLLKHLDETTPIHCDPWIFNFIVDKNEKMFLVDWEFAVNGDHHWDVAYFLDSAYLNESQRNIFLSAYQLKIDPLKLQIASFLINYITICWLFKHREFKNMFPYEPLLQYLKTAYENIKYLVL